MTTDKTCFLISPIGDPGSDIRIRADLILDFVVRPAAEQRCNYTVTRADEISLPGMITGQIMDRINSDDLVIADLTGLNPNVFYELAVRHAVNKPVIQMMEMGEEPPFDVAGMRTIFVDHHDLRSANECIEELVGAITAIEEVDARVISPISFSVDLEALRRAGDASAEENAIVLNQLRSEMSQQRRLLNNIDHWLTRSSGSSVHPSIPVPTMNNPDLGRKFADLMSAVENLRDDKRCVSCGTGNPIDSDQCQKCGAELLFQNE